MSSTQRARRTRATTHVDRRPARRIWSAAAMPGHRRWCRRISSSCWPSDEPGTECSVQHGKRVAGAHVAHAVDDGPARNEVGSAAVDDHVRGRRVPAMEPAPTVALRGAAVVEQRQGRARRGRGGIGRPSRAAALAWRHDGVRGGAAGCLGDVQVAVPRLGASSHRDGHGIQARHDSRQFAPFNRPLELTGGRPRRRGTRCERRAAGAGRTASDESRRGAAVLDGRAARICGQSADHAVPCGKPSHLSTYCESSPVVRVRAARGRSATKLGEVRGQRVRRDPQDQSGRCRVQGGGDPR